MKALILSTVAVSSLLFSGSAMADTAIYNSKLSHSVSMSYASFQSSDVTRLNSKHSPAINSVSAMGNTRVFNSKMAFSLPCNLCGSSKT